MGATFFISLSEKGLDAHLDVSLLRSHFVIFRVCKVQSESEWEWLCLVFNLRYSVSLGLYIELFQGTDQWDKNASFSKKGLCVSLKEFIELVRGI